MRHRVLITRERARSAELISSLRAEGISAIAEPVTTLARIADGASLPDLSRIDWIAFTSANGADMFFEILAESGHMLPPDVRIAAVGPATASIVSKNLRTIDLIGSGSGGADLAAALLDFARGETEFTVLWPCAQDAQPDFATCLSASGVKVFEWQVYAPNFVPPWLLQARLERPSSFDVVVFAAPSAVRSLKEAWPEAWTFTAVAIGESTAAAVRKFPVTRCVVSPSPRTADLVATIKQALHDSDHSLIIDSPEERS